jgi:hypothetical protein
MKQIKQVKVKVKKVKAKAKVELILTLTSTLTWFFLTFLSPAYPQDISIRDEGGGANRARELNFTGPGINATVSGGVATINAPAQDHSQLLNLNADSHPQYVLANSSLDYCPDLGSSDAYICGRFRPATSYITGMSIDLRPNTVNTGAATVNVDGLGVRTITQHDGTALTDGMLAAGRIYRLNYHSDGTFRMAGGIGGAIGSGTTNKLVKWATAETLGDSMIQENGSNLEIGNVSGNHYVYSYAAPTAVRTISVPNQANLQMGPFGVYWDGGAITPDGTNCADPTKQTLNSGPIGYFFSCADSDSSIFYGQVILPVALATVTFKLSLFHGTTESITFAGDFSAECRGAGTAINNTWGTVQAADVAITTANQVAEAITSALTPNGTCSVGSMLFWRYVVDATNFSPNAVNSKVIGVYMEKNS